MDNANTGIAYLSIDGQTYRVAAELTYDPGSVDRETLKGQDGIHGVKITPRAPFISAVIRESGGLSVADFNAMDDVTIFIEELNGKSVTGRSMWQVGETAVNTEEGTVTVRWEGPQGAVVEQPTAA
jgi:hypothetical protein